MRVASRPGVLRAGRRGLVLALASALNLAMAGPGLAACRNDFLMVVSAQGALLATSRNGVFQVMRQDLVDPSSWAAGQAVSICLYPGVGGLRLFTMTNLRRSESLMVTRAGGNSAERPRR